MKRQPRAYRVCAIGIILSLLILNSPLSAKDFSWEMFFPAISGIGSRISPPRCDAQHLDLCKDKSSCESAGLFWYGHFPICSTEDSNTHVAVGGWADNTSPSWELYYRYYPDGTVCNSEFGSPGVSGYLYWAPISPTKFIVRRSIPNFYAEYEYFILNHSTYYGISTYPYEGRRYYYYRVSNPNSYPCK